MSDFNSLVQYTVESISRPVKYIIYKLTEFIRVVDKFVFRQVPTGAASGYATIEKVEGNTVQFNQLVDTGIYSNVLPYSRVVTEVSVNSDNEIEVKTIATASMPYSRGFKTSPFSSLTNIVGHKYLILCESKSDTQYSYSSDSALMGVTSPFTILNYTANQWCATGTIMTATNTNNSFILRVSQQPAVGSYFYFRNFQLFDLTRIFGSGNEPTTVAEFEAWMAQNIGSASYYDYNAGELISVKMSGMQTEDSSQQVVDTIALDVTTITGINTSTNVREVMFSSGMKQADREGAVKDTLDLLSDTATVNVGSRAYQSGDESDPDVLTDGTTTYYALTTPIEYTDLQDQYGNPLNPRYKVEQGGTEQVLPTNTSTPTTVAPTLTTTYTKDNN